MKDFVIEVVSCKDASFWYADKIGQRFPIRRIGDKESYVSTFDSYNTGNYVQNEDIKIVKVEKSNGSTKKESYPTTR